MVRNRHQIVRLIYSCSVSVTAKSEALGCLRSLTAPAAHFFQR